MSQKKIERIISPPQPHFVGDGFRVHNFIPGVHQLSMERMSPFILLDYNSPHYFPPSEIPRGVGVHPHRGFETVTIAYKGKIAHHDSYGNKGVIGTGDVQWMTAASGVLHKEYHEKEFSREGGEFQMVQLWVNLPAKFKMSSPKYQGIQNASIPKVELSNNAGIVEIIAGAFNGKHGAAFTFTPLHLLNVKLVSGGETTFTFPEAYNTALLVLEGNVLVNNREIVHANNLLLFDNVGETFQVKAIDSAVVLVFSGEPILEPIAAHGPFVMNTQAELEQAYEDFNLGRFGVLAN